MWLYVVTSFTRYSKVGREAQKAFDKALKKDGFHHLHANLYLRYCPTSANAAMHKKRIKKLIPIECCDISIIMSSDNVEQHSYHSLKRKCKQRALYEKPLTVEFF